MPTYSQLNQRNPSVDHERNEELECLYEGGRRFERHVGKLLPQRTRERAERYRSRLGEAEYRNYVGPIIDFFASMLFVARPDIKAKRNGELVSDPGEYWSALQEDCDGGGTDLDAFFKDVLIDAMKTKTGWIRLRSPTTGSEEPQDLAAFQKSGLGNCWLEDVESCCALDWDTSDDGRLLWVLTHGKEAKRTGVASARDTIVETWEYLTADSAETFSVEYKSDKPPNGNDEIPSLGSVRHRFGAVPVVCLDLPAGLWVAERLRSPQVAHFRKQSALNWSLAATAYAMPVANVADPDAFGKALMGAGYEIIIGKDDKWTWEAPPTGHFAALDAEIKSTKDEIFRIAHQMALGVQNNAAAVGRSAQSKVADMESTRVVLAALSRLVKETIEYTLDLIATARGEADIEWSVEGLDDFAALDVDQFLTQLAIIKDKVGAIPSRTFWVEANKRAAASVLRDLDEETSAKINEEIERDTTDPAEDAQAERDAFLLATKGTVAPGGVGVGTSAAAPAAKPAADSGSGRPANGKVAPGAKAG